MRLTIIKDDNMVYIDGVALRVDCSSLPGDFHALQWYETWGDVETVDANGHHVANVEITDLTPYQHLIDGWHAAKAAIDAAAPPPMTTAKGTVNVIA